MRRLAASICPHKNLVKRIRPLADFTATLMATRQLRGFRRNHTLPDLVITRCQMGARSMPHFYLQVLPFTIISQMAVYSFYYYRIEFSKCSSFYLDGKIHTVASSSLLEAGIRISRRE